MHNRTFLAVLAMVGAGLVTADGNTNSAVTVSRSLLKYALALRLTPAHLRPQADGDRIVAGYLPEIWPAVIALLLYGCSAAIHWTAWWRSGRPRYMLVLTISMTSEWIRPTDEFHAADTRYNSHDTRFHHAPRLPGRTLFSGALHYHVHAATPLALRLPRYGLYASLSLEP
jgi:hypothetical protein